MAVFESARRPGRVDLPLAVAHSPLGDLLARSGNGEGSQPG
jgi:hypothetical protein